MNIKELHKEAQKNEKLYQSLLFFSKMLFAGAIFHLILYIYPNTIPVQSAFAGLITSIMNLFSGGFIHQGIAIKTSGMEYLISQDCLGWKSMMATVALIYASTERTLEHVRFIGAAIGVIFVANIVRVVTTITLSEANIISFAIIHDVLWKWSLTALVLVIWVYWMRNHKDKPLEFQKRIKNEAEKVRSQKQDELE